jgi:peptide/nickel transport system substrate-binding protein
MNVSRINIKPIAFTLLFLIFTVGMFAEKVLIYAEQEKPLSYFPYISDDPITIRVLDLLYETVVKDFSDAVKTKENVTVLPLKSNLVTLSTLRIDFSSSPHMSMSLRNNIYWGNGSKITPDDVIFTIENIIKDKSFTTTYSYLAQTIREVRRKENSLEFTFYFPSQYMVSALEFFVLPSRIQSASQLKELAKKIKLSDLKGYLSGPYFVEKEEPSRIIFVKNPKSNVPTKIDKVVLVKEEVSKNMVDKFLAGEIHLIAPVTVDSEFKKISNVEYSTIKSFPSFDRRFYYVAFNYDNEIFLDKKLRILMSKAIDRNEILNNILMGYGQILSGPLHPSFPGSNPNVKPYEYDPEAVEELKNKYAGKLGKLTLLYARDPARRNERLASAISEYLGAAGIRVELLGLSYDAYYQRLRSKDKKRFDLAIVEYYSNATFTSLRPLLEENGTLNFGNFNSKSNGSYDTDLTRLLQDVEGDNAFRMRQDVRIEKYRAIHKMCHENAYHIWLVAPQTVTYLNSEVVSVDYFVPDRPFKNISEWNINK